RRYRYGFTMADGFDATTLEDGGVRENSDRERSNAFANVVWKPVEGLTLGLVGSGITGEYGVPSTVVDNPADVFAQRPRFERVEDQAGYAFQGSFDYDRGSWFARGWGYGNRLRQDENRYDDDTYTDIDDETVNGTFLTTVKTTITGFGLQAGTSLGAARLTVGVDLHRDNWTQTGVIRDVALGGGGGGGGGGTGGGGGGGGGGSFALGGGGNDVAVGDGFVVADQDYEAVDGLVSSVERHTGES